MIAKNDVIILPSFQITGCWLHNCKESVACSKRGSSFAKLMKVRLLLSVEARGSLAWT